MLKNIIKKIMRRFANLVWRVAYGRAPAQNTAPQQGGTRAFMEPDLINRVNEVELDASVEFIREHLHKVVLRHTANDLREYALGMAPKEGALLEFGVFKARSTNFFADLLLEQKDIRTWHGFDSFEGLSEAGYGWIWEKGRFNLNGQLPAVRDNVVLHKGWVNETLPPFLSTLDEKIAFIHIDLDIYEPTKCVLELCKPYLVPGSIIVFDELMGYAGWRFHEYKALQEVLKPEEYEYVSFSGYFQAAIQITDKIKNK